MTDGKTQGSPRKEIDVHFAKSSLCRVVHADGAWGGVTPQLNIYMALFTERANLPKAIKYSVDPRGAPTETGKVGGQDFVREVEVEVMMNVEVARALKDWLDDKITKATEARQKLQKSTAPGSQ